MTSNPFCCHGLLPRTEAAFIIVGLLQKLFQAFPYPVGLVPDNDAVADVIEDRTSPFVLLFFQGNRQQADLPYRFLRFLAVDVEKAQAVYVVAEKLDAQRVLLIDCIYINNVAADGKMAAPLNEIDSFVSAFYKTLQEHIPFVLRAGFYIDSAVVNALRRQYILKSLLRCRQYDAGPAFTQKTENAHLLRRPFDAFRRRRKDSFVDERKIQNRHIRQPELQIGLPGRSLLFSRHDDQRRPLYFSQRIPCEGAFCRASQSVNAVPPGQLKLLRCLFNIFIVIHPLKYLIHCLTS